VLHSGIYNIAGPELITVRGLALSIAHAMDRRTLLVPVPRVLFRILLNMGPIRPSTLTRSRYRLFGTHRYTSTDKAERAGFSPRYNFDTTAKIAVKWYAERGLL
jgi:nucleoside-diphosphate-sugar epimerase